MTIFGDGEQTRDYVYVGDVVAAVVAAIGRDGGVFNVGTGTETSVNELAIARGVARLATEATYAPARAGDALRSVLDVSPDRARARLAAADAARGGPRADVGLGPAATSSRSAPPSGSAPRPP